MPTFFFSRLLPFLLAFPCRKGMEAGRFVARGCAVWFGPLCLFGVV